MTKSQKFLLAISRLETTPPENVERIISCIDKDQVITFFNWKLYDIKVKNNIVWCNSKFNIKTANKFIKREKRFINILTDLKIKFNYLKIVPNELPTYLFNKSNTTGAIMFALQVRNYFRKIYLPTQTFLFTNLLEENKLLSVYQSIFTYVYKNSNSLVDQNELTKEIQFRSTYYSLRPIELNFSRKLAKKAFALFAAEANCLFKIFENPVLLSKSGSSNSYKYEFYKYPKNRPILPKLFVI